MGKPVIMHRLPGVPSEYYRYILSPHTADITGLRNAILHATEMPVDELAQLGNDARTFILSTKTPGAQVQRLVQLWDFLFG